MKVKVLAGVLILFGGTPAWAQESVDLNFASGLREFRELRKMLPSYLNGIAFEMLAGRQARVARIATMEELGRRKTEVRKCMVEDFGGFPERTPLNPRVIGTLEREGYKVEKIVFESQPRFYVTANLYLPTSGQPPYPAILFPLGHEARGKANPTWQQMLGSLARKGFVSLAWDPVGQGERSQFYDEDLEDSKVGNATTEHTVVGIQCMLIGDHVARYTIWDGIRALDYLLSRREVDPTRVGCTGNSGGGTHTAYLAALDDRIKVALPSCYITSWRLLLETIGPQDAEQVFPSWLEQGLDFPDFIYAFAPKPYLVLSAIRDFFPIAGARETFSEAKRVYSAIGAEEKLVMFEADDGHGYTKPRRMAAYKWFSRWLKGVEADGSEPEIKMASPEELWCTPTGQVANSLGGETVYSLNRKRMEEMLAKRSASPADAVRKARELAHYEPPQGPPTVNSYGMLSRSGYRIDKLVYESERGIVVPSLLYVPDGGESRKPALILVDSAGKARSHEDAEQFVKSGVAVLSIDARGFGETFPGTEEDSREFDRFFRDCQSGMKALVIGRNLVGMRAHDISRGVDLLVARPDIDRDGIYGFGKGGGAVPMLYAAALDGRLRKVAFEGLLLSYERVITGRIHRQVFEDVVPGALKSYDLPDLVSAIAPRETWIVNSVNELGHRIAAGDVAKSYGRALEAFRRGGAEGALRIRDRRPGEETIQVYREFVASR